MGISLIRKASDREREDRWFSQWVVQLPWMDKDTFIPFSDYRDRLSGAGIDTRSVEEIMADLEDVERQFAGGGNNGA